MPPTGAAQIILGIRGRIEVGDEGIMIHAPTGVGTIGNCRTASTVLYAAERHVIAWDTAKHEGSLPYQQVAPNGILV